ncbi:MAG: kelch repeat-containing protein [Pseudomonadota bacterium]
MRTIPLLCCLGLLCTSAVSFAENDPLLELPRERLPAPVSNNAVARVSTSVADYLVSFTGLGAGKGHGDVHARVYQRRMTDRDWTDMGLLPDNIGRLAAVAVGVGPHAYVFGGYTVAEDGAEVSTPEVWRYDPNKRVFKSLAQMPVPVDDAVAVVYQDRFIYLVSGWHDLANVNLVQRYDIETNTWAQATPWPGRSVFGHAGGIVNNTMIICDGVAVVVGESGPRRFEMTDECYRGTINVENARRIDWHRLPAHPGAARYRMAASGSAAMNAVVFAGGSDNPYNFDGIGYNGEPSEPVAALFVFDLETNAWRPAGQLSPATMDHRALIELDSGRFMTIGGMRGGQQVSDQVVEFAVKPQ